MWLLPAPARLWHRLNMYESHMCVFRRELSMETRSLICILVYTVLALARNSCTYSVFFHSLLLHVIHFICTCTCTCHGTRRTFGNSAVVVTQDKAALYRIQTVIVTFFFSRVEHLDVQWRRVPITAVNISYTLLICRSAVVSNGP